MSRHSLLGSLFLTGLAIGVVAAPAPPEPMPSSEPQHVRVVSAGQLVLGSDVLVRDGDLADPWFVRTPAMAGRRGTGDLWWIEAVDTTLSRLIGLVAASHG